MSQPKESTNARYKRGRAICRQAKKTVSAAQPGAGEPTSGDTRRLRLRCANRSQVTPIPALLDGLLPPNHPARRMWDWVDQQADLHAFYESIVVVEDGPGQAATDPKILITLWLHALTQGITSARELDDLCVKHLDYIWICGGVSMNYHTLSDFRVQHAQALDDLLTQLVKQLQQAGLADLEQVAQDGMRVRASAGAASFHRKPTLEKHLAAAQASLVALQAPAQTDSAPEAVTAQEEAAEASLVALQAPAQTDSAPEAVTAREEAARERAARERVERLTAALAEMPAAQAAKDANKKGEEARVSSTDPEARVMKMADGGYRPAYNVQFATDTKKLGITGVDVTNSGSDKAEMPPMVEYG